MRIRYETQFAREEAGLRAVRADVHETGTERSSEECLDPAAQGGVELVERAIHHQPLRPLQQHTREAQTLLFLFVQPPVPAVGRVEK